MLQQFVPFLVHQKSYTFMSKSTKKLLVSTLVMPLSDYCSKVGDQLAKLA